MLRQSIRRKTETRPGVDKVKPRVWFKLYVVTLFHHVLFNMGVRGGYLLYIAI